MRKKFPTLTFFDSHYNNLLFSILTFTIKRNCEGKYFSLSAVNHSVTLVLIVLKIFLMINEISIAFWES